MKVDLSAGKGRERETSFGEQRGGDRLDVMQCQEEEEEEEEGRERVFLRVEDGLTTQIRLVDP